MKACVPALAAAALLATGSTLHADVVLSFYHVTNNNSDATAAGEAQLSVTVGEQDGMASFTFENDGPVASSITDIYFDDGTLLDLATIINGPGVLFSVGANPGELPGANAANPPFVTTAGFSADSDAPPTPNGVNPGEFVQVLFTLQDAQTIDDVYADLFSGALRVGMHVQGYPGGFSEGFVNEEVIPAPGSAAAFLALAAFGARRRR